MEVKLTAPSHPPVSIDELHPKPFAVSIRGAVHRYGTSRTKLYEMVKSGKLKLRKNGKNSLLLTTEADAVFANLPTT